MKKVFFLLGAPCSGKGTQGSFLKKEFFYASAGDLLREKYPITTEIGKSLYAGNIVATEIIQDLILEKIKDSKLDRIILDGFPRSLEQAIFVKREFPKIVSISGTIILYSKKDVLIDRLKNRTMCFSCNGIYSKFVNCCGKESVKREDDNLEIFEKRLKVYEKDINDILCVLEGPIYFINSDDNKEDIYKKILKIMNN